MTRIFPQSAALLSLAAVCLTSSTLTAQPLGPGASKAVTRPA